MKKINVTADSISEGVARGVEMVLREIYKALASQDFINYLSNHLFEVLKTIATERVSTISIKDLDNSSSEMSNYLGSMKMSINGNTISLFNDSKIILDEKQLKPSTRARYSNELSLAHIIEFGIGYIGGSSSAADKQYLLNESWEYDVRNHGSKGWYYKDKNGNIVWTQGLEGRQVFIGLIEYIQENIGNIITNYLNKI